MFYNNFYSNGGAQQQSNTPSSNDHISNIFGNLQNFQQQKQILEQQIQQSGQSPEQIVRSLISSGQMTQEQFMRYSQLANCMIRRM